MQGEKFFFRKKFFGGFNRDDVIAYIAQIAGERNKAIDDKEIAEAEIVKLRESINEKQEIINSYEKLIEKLRSRKEQTAKPPETTPVAVRVQAAPPPAPLEPQESEKRSVIKISHKKANK